MALVTRYDTSFTAVLCAPYCVLLTLPHLAICFGQLRLLWAGPGGSCSHSALVELFKRHDMLYSRAQPAVTRLSIPNGRPLARPHSAICSGRLRLLGAVFKHEERTSGQSDRLFKALGDLPSWY